MSGKCSECANAIEKYAPANKSYPIHYQQWQSVDNRVEKVDIMGTVDDCFDKLKTSWAFLVACVCQKEAGSLFQITSSEM